MTHPVVRPTNAQRRLTVLLVIAVSAASCSKDAVAPRPEDTFRALVSGSVTDTFGGAASYQQFSGDQVYFEFRAGGTSTPKRIVVWTPSLVLQPGSWPMGETLPGANSVILADYWIGGPPTFIGFYETFQGGTFTIDSMARDTAFGSTRFPGYGIGTDSTTDSVWVAVTFKAARVSLP